MGRGRGSHHDGTAGKGGKGSGEGDADDALTISTIHASKGLQWHAVFAMRWCDTYLPTCPPAYTVNEQGEVGERARHAAHCNGVAQGSAHAGKGEAKPWAGKHACSSLAGEGDHQLGLLLATRLGGEAPDGTAAWLL